VDDLSRKLLDEYNKKHPHENALVDAAEAAEHEL
jgi:hypothetical protein